MPLLFLDTSFIVMKQKGIREVLAFDDHFRQMSFEVMPF